MSDAALNQEKEQLLDDVRQVLSSTEDLLGAAGDEGGEKGREGEGQQTGRSQGSVLLRVTQSFRRDGFPSQIHRTCGAG